jgi:hypothetical protein
MMRLSGGLSRPGQPQRPSTEPFLASTRCERSPPCASPAPRSPAHRLRPGAALAAAPQPVAAVAPPAKPVAALTPPAEPIATIPGAALAAAPQPVAAVAPPANPRGWGYPSRVPVPWRHHDGAYPCDCQPR